MNPSRPVDTTAEPAFATRDGGQIVAWNASAETLLGYREAEILGKTCYQTLRGRDTFGNSYCCCLNCPVRRMVRQHEAVHPFEICFRSSAGKYIPVVASVIVTPEEEPSRPDVIHLLYPQKERVLESEPPLDLDPTEDAFSYYVRLGRLRSFVEIHYADPISLELAAEVATMEPRYFSKFFHDKTGVCFKDWLAKDAGGSGQGDDGCEQLHHHPDRLLGGLRRPPHLRAQFQEARGNDPAGVQGDRSAPLRSKLRGIWPTGIKRRPGMSEEKKIHRRLEQVYQSSCCCYCDGERAPRQRSLRRSPLSTGR